MNTKPLTDQGKLQCDGGSGQPLTDLGHIQEDGGQGNPLSETGSTQRNTGSSYDPKNAPNNELSGGVAKVFSNFSIDTAGIAKSVRK